MTFGKEALVIIGRKTGKGRQNGGIFGSDYLLSDGDYRRCRKGVLTKGRNGTCQARNISFSLFSIFSEVLTAASPFLLFFLFLLLLLLFVCVRGGVWQLGLSSQRVQSRWLARSLSLANTRFGPPTLALSVGAVCVYPPHSPPWHRLS